jgi:hypothetical protein
MDTPTTRFKSEPPTKPAENHTGKMIAFAMRVDRLAALAIERLEVSVDDDARLAALADLAQVRALAGTVLR